MQSSILEYAVDNCSSMLNTEPLVSVIIPTYNRAEIVREAIDNVLQQTYANIEIIVVDDGSTDDTIARLKSYGERIQVVTQQNAGPAAARNNGVKVSHGEILAFQDSDDSWHPSKIERQVSLLQRAGEDVPCCLCNSIVHMHGGQTMQSFDRVQIDKSLQEGIWLNPFEILATRFILFNQAVAVRRAAFEKVGGFDESLRLMEDVDLQLRLALEGPWTFIREPLAIRQERSSSSLSHVGTREMLCEYEVGIRKNVLRKIEQNRPVTLALPLMQRELRRALRQRFATQVEGMKFPGARFAGIILERIERLRNAIYRRGPLFPRMKVAPLDSHVHDRGKTLVRAASLQ